ncbi:Inner membrane protein YedI [compost metagenome]
MYGLVAAIVRMDDAGLVLEKSRAQGACGTIVRKLGGILLSAAPILMKSLSWIGTIAMFLVGGTFVTDGIEPLTHFVDVLVEGARNWELAVTLAIHCVIGALVGMTVVALVKIVSTISAKAAR